MKLNRRHITLGALILAGAGLLAVCANNKIEWTEEVLLQSGETIVVERTATTKPFGEIGGPGGWENEGMTMRVIQPQRPDNPPTWDARFVPLLFDRDPETNQWFVVATFYSCTSWYDLGRPALPYTEYRLKDGKWVQGSLTQSLIGRKANMLTNISSKGEPNHTVTSKGAVMSDPRVVLKAKEIVATWRTSC